MRPSTVAGATGGYEPSLFTGQMTGSTRSRKVPFFMQPELGSRLPLVDSGWSYGAKPADAVRGRDAVGCMVHDGVMPTRPVTIVTGGSRGIGAEAVLRLARDGHDLAVGYRVGAVAAGDVAAAAQDMGVRAVAVRVDVTEPDDVDALFAEAAEQLGPVTGLVANAGLTAHVADLADTPIDAVRKVLDVNLLGVILCARRAAQVMSRRRGGPGGAIVAVSSGAATLGAPHEYVHYAAAKAGVDALVVGLAKELADDGVRVNAVAPGLVRTGIHADAGDPDRVERVAGRVPMRRAGEPDEIAPAIAWLLGPEAGYCTGTVLRVAGGL